MTALTAALLITGGLVAVEDGAKHDPSDQYSLSRKVRVEMKFDVAEGSDPADVIQLVGDMAGAEVSRLLGRPATTARFTETTTTAGEPAAAATARPRRTKAQIAADEAAAAAAAAKAAGTTTDPADMGGAAASPQGDPSVIQDGATTSGGTGSSGDGATSDDPAAMDEWDVPAAEVEAAAITDADLNAAVQKKNGELGDPPKIRNLIGSFNPDQTKPFQLRQIPAAQRQGFLDKLAALTKG